MRKLLLCITFFAFCVRCYVSAQADTGFWFAAPYFNCVHGADGAYRLVVFSFDEEATVTVSMPANPDYPPIVRTLAANSYTEITLARNKYDGDDTITTPFNKVTNRGLLVKSTGKIECYYQVDGANSEAFTLKGRNALGTEFLVVGQKSYDQGTDGEFLGARCSIHLVASEDNTVVNIHPSAAVLLSDGTSSADMITVTLNKGETYAIASYDTRAVNNLVGTVITSNNPIAVTLNDDSVERIGCVDNVGEQLVPVDFAGTQFVVISGGFQFDLCTVFALHDNTSVKTSAGHSFTINKGGYQTISMNGSTALSVSASAPVMVFQTLSTENGSGELGGTVVPHIECTGSNVAGYKTFSDHYNVYINLITKSKNINHFTINGIPVSPSEFRQVDASSDYYYARIREYASSEPYIVKCSSGFFQMGVTEGDWNSSSTYGFFSNYGTFYESSDSAVFAEGTPYIWEGHYMRDGVTPITLTREGTYSDTLSAADGCDSVVTLHLALNRPVLTVTADDRCADDPYVDFLVQVNNGAVIEVQFTFDDEAIAQGFRDTTVACVGGTIQIPNRARAGRYGVTLTYYYNGQDIRSERISFTLLYPSSVLEQNWDDFIGVLTHDYNGGYDFTAFRWYENGEIMTGQTRSYIYNCVVQGYRYSALLTESDGTQLMTCELEAYHRDEITVYPTLVPRRRMFRVRTSRSAVVSMYAATGTHIMTRRVSGGETELPAPSVQGLYLLYVQLEGTDEVQPVKLIVR